MDARFVWMRQKRIQGSHFATLKQASEINELMSRGVIKPLLSETFDFDAIPQAHSKMMNNQHKPGNMAVLVQARDKTR